MSDKGMYTCACGESIEVYGNAYEEADYGLIYVYHQGSCMLLIKVQRTRSAIDAALELLSTINETFEVDFYKKQGCKLEWEL